jgi:Fe-S-cluster containining protein
MDNQRIEEGRTMITIEACKTCTDVCCLRTTYKLTNEDLHRIMEVRRGDALRDATIRQTNGNVQLKAPCRFYNKGCSAYEHRFTGCRIYPIVYYDGKPAVDRSCPGHKEITREQIVEHTPTVLKYMHDITFEAQMRRKEQ